MNDKLEWLAQRHPAKTIGAVAYIVICFLALVFGSPVA